MTQENITTKFRVDISELKSGIQEANRSIRQANSEFKAVASGMDNWKNSTEGLTAKIKQLSSVEDAEKKKLENLKQQYEAVTQEQGENSKGAQELAIKINNQQASVNRVTKELNEYEDRLDTVKTAQKNAEKSGRSLDEELDNLEKGLKDVEDASEETSGGFTIMKGAIASLVADGIKNFVGSVVNAVAESREFRNELAMLRATAETTGTGFDKAKKTLKEIATITDDTGAGVEAVNNMMSAGFKGENLDKLTEQLLGASIKWKDTLKMEGLADGLQETLATGNAVGPFSELLERGGKNLDTFNAGLAKCKTEAEKQKFVLNELSELGLKPVLDDYKENNKYMLMNAQASYELQQRMSQFGQIVEPVVASVKKGFADILGSVMDLGDGVNLEGFAGKMSSAFDLVKNVISGKMSVDDLISIGSNWIKGLGDGISNAVPRVLDTTVGLIGMLIDSITQNGPTLLTAGVSLISNLVKGVSDSVAQNLPTLISKCLNMLVSLTGSLRENAPKLIQAGLSLIQNLVKGLMHSLPELISKVPIIVSNIANAINDNVPTILKSAVNIIWTIIKGLISAIPTLVSNIPKIISAIVDVWSAFNWLSLGKKAITGLGNGIKSLYGWIKGIGVTVKDAIVNAIKNLPQTLMNLGKSGIKGLGSAISGAKSFVITAIKNIFNAIVNGIKNLPSKMLSIGKDVVKGLWNGISNMTGWVIDKIQGFGDSILDGIKDFFGIHSPSKVMEQQVGKQLALGVANGIKKNSKYAGKSASEMGQLILDSAEKRLNRYKTYNKLSLVAEKAYWDEVRNQCKKGTSARLEADKKYFETKKALNEQSKSAEKEYTESIKNAYKTLETDIANALEEYTKAVESRTSAILGSMGLFDEFTKNTELSGNQLLANLKSQVTGLENWIETLDKLEEKGIDSGLIEELRNMGPSASGQLDALNSMTAEQLNQYVELWKQKNSLATDQAKKELEGLQIETQNKIISLVEETKKSLTGYKNVYDKALKDLGVAVKSNVKETNKTLIDTAQKSILKTAPSIGSDTVQGIIDGLDAKSGALYSKIASIMREAIATAQATAQIASPSKIMRDLIGKNLVRGVTVGMESESKGLFSTMKGIIKNTIGSANTEGLHAIRSSLNQMKSTLASVSNFRGDRLVGVGSSVTEVTNTFNQTINSPKSLSRREIYRDTKNLIKLVGG